MKTRRGGIMSNVWWFAAALAIWGDVFLKSYRMIYPETPDTGKLLHIATLAFFAMGWAARKEFETNEEPRGDYRFGLNKAFRYLIVVALLLVGMIVGFGHRLTPDPEMAILLDYIGLGIFIVLVVMGRILFRSYHRLLEKYGIKSS